MINKSDEVCTKCFKIKFFCQCGQCEFCHEDKINCRCREYEDDNRHDTYDFFDHVNEIY